MEWEYMSLKSDERSVFGGTVDVKLTEMGTLGWELVGLTQRERHGTSHEVVFFFKRQKKNLR
jgi:hypothetical protein